MAVVGMATAATAMVVTDITAATGTAVKVMAVTAMDAAPTAGTVMGADTAISEAMATAAVTTNIIGDTEAASHRLLQGRTVHRKSDWVRADTGSLFQATVISWKRPIISSLHALDARPW